MNSNNNQEVTTNRWINLTGDINTQPRSPFMNWIRTQKNLTSRNTAGGGFVVQDIDTLIRNYRTKKFMMLELKCHMADISYAEVETYTILTKVMTGSVNKDWLFKGIYLFQFENTCPNDGYTKVSKCGDGGFVYLHTFKNESEVSKFIEDTLK